MTINYSIPGKTRIKNSPMWKYAASLLLFSVLYYLSARLGLYLEVQYGGITPIWPPSGVAVAVFLTKGRKYWPMVILGEFIIARNLNQPHMAGLIGGAAQVLEASLSVYFLSRLGIREITNRAGSVLWFSALGVLVPPMFSSAIGASTLLYFHYLSSNEFAAAVLTWWLGDAIGILVLTPLLADLKTWPFRSLAACAQWIAYTLLVVSVGYAIIVLGNERSYYLFFILIPLVIISAIHFRLIGAGSATFLLAIMVFGMRPQDLSKGDFLTAIRMAFVGTSAFTGYLVTGFMERRQRRLETIRRQKDYLSTLHDLALGLISRLEMDRLINSIIEGACKLLNVKDGVFSLWDDESSHIQVKIGTGVYSGIIGYTVSAGQGLVGKIWETGCPMRINEYQKWEGRHPDKLWDPVTAIMGVPIKADQEIIGVLSVLSTEKDFQFSDDDLEIIKRLGELASVACHNTRMYSQLSEELKARQLAESSLVQLRTAIEFAVEDIMITQTDGTITYVNPAFERTTGYSKGEVLGKKPSILKSGLQDKQFYSELWTTILRGDLWTGQIRNKCKNGNIVLQETNIAPIRNASNDIAGFVSVKRDITEQAEIRKQLIQAQKMQAIGTLASGIAHDFNNILSGIIGYTELAVTYDLPADHPATKNLQEVLHASYRASDLVKQILTFSRSTEIEAQAIDVKTIIKEVSRLIDASLPPTIELKLSFDAAVTHAKASPTNIHQIVMNLITNAAHALPDEKGTITIDVSNRTVGDQPPAIYSKLKKGEYLEISVSDTGSGMDEDTMGKVFEPYFTTKDIGKGTGLGLSIVHGIVSSLDGTIYVESTIGKGSIFRVLLPIDKKALQCGIEDPRPLPTGNESILFVDDNPMLIDIGTQTLKKLGYNVTALSEAAVALDRFKANPDDFCLVITDMTMPKMSGLELSQEISTIRPETPIIICTGNPYKISKEELKKFNIKAVALKPLDLASMSELVRKTLDACSCTADPQIRAS